MDLKILSLKLSLLKLVWLLFVRSGLYTSDECATFRFLSYLKNDGPRFNIWCSPINIVCILGMPRYTVFEYKPASTIFFYLTLCSENSIDCRDALVAYVSKEPLNLLASWLWFNLTVKSPHALGAVYFSDVGSSSSSSSIDSVSGGERSLRLTIF